MGSMAPPREEQQEKRGGVLAEDDAPRYELAKMIARLGIDEPAEDAVALLRSRDWEESAASDFFSSAFLRSHRGTDQGAYRPAASIIRAAGPAPPPPMHPVGIPLAPRDRGMPDARPIAEGRLRGGGLASMPRNEPGAGMPPQRARGVLPDGDHAYVAPPPYLHGAAANRQDPNLFAPVNEQAVLFALSQETPEKIVSTEDVIFMINSCETPRSMQLFRDAMVQWMSPNQMRVLLSDSKRLQVVHAFIARSPSDIAQTIFEVVSKDCTRLACQPNGLGLLQNCLERVSWMERDDIFTQLSYQSLQLALNSCGNWIVQDILKRGDTYHLAIIASCLRHHYVALAKNKYGSNVVEWCLRVFHEGERLIIVNELIYYPHFRDLVTNEFANFTLSTALETCEVPTYLFS
ncbi:hypothetical protein BAE44_0021005 [Dichanthelium oligosanthes]|uniref:PUM-HD domain-containing protein n=1 Tax=Dichanthelium oligosanthes TaxID=888268 RepID=A0A1E5UYW3_9POAL|nr:hypothetical protein BAE44_0021005 [Dichanthelium oligosanthes]